MDLAAVKPLAKTVSLDAIKADRILKDILLVRNSRLSVSPLDETQFKHLLTLAETRV